MIKIDVFSGFLGAGKTTLIKKLIKEAYAGEKLVLIENEFGDIGIDGGFMKEAGITVNELNSGCICCSLVGDFAKALKEVVDRYAPDRIIIEPSGVGKLSDVVKAVESAGIENSCVNSQTAVVDAGKCKMYMKNFGEFFNDQIRSAKCIIFSHADVTPQEKLLTAVSLVKEQNPVAVIVTTDWRQLDGKQLLQAIERTSTLQIELSAMQDEHDHCCHHDHDGEEHDHCCHHDHDGEEHEHCCHHDHDEDERDHCCHHDHDGEEHEHCCHHDHDGDEHDHCHHHEHHHDHHHEHGHHHADEVFASWGAETAKQFDKAGLEDILSALGDVEKYGLILRAKGIVRGQNGEWLHFDYVPDEKNVRTGTAEITGRLCVIGSKINEQNLKALFGV